MSSSAARDSQDQLLDLMKTKLLLSNDATGSDKKNLILLYFLPFLSKFVDEFANCTKARIEASIKAFFKLLFSFHLVSDRPDTYLYKIDLKANMNQTLFNTINDLISEQLQQDSDTNQVAVRKLDLIDIRLGKVQESIVDTRLIHDQWVEFAYFPGKCIEIKVVETKREENKESVTDRTLLLRAKHKEHIREFMTVVLKKIVDNQPKQSQTKRKLRYLLMVPRPPIFRRIKDTDHYINFKMSTLSHTKSFDSLFFPNRDLIVEQLTHFKNGTGLYAKDGAPNKLGFLLQGPPGTGKTSFIKAVSNFMNRDLVSISLAGIDTNEEFYDLMHNAAKRVIRQNGKDTDIVDFYYADTIFVFEDIDCMGDTEENVLLQRKKKFEATIMKKRENKEKRKKRKERMMKKREKMKKKKQKEKRAAEKGSDEESESESDSESETELLEDYDDDQFFHQTMLSSFFNKKTLDLSGILNVLDGIIDTPQRMIIMTTNHKEKLDPALIRSGRIDREILMDYLQFPEALEMTKYYLDIKDDELEPENVQELKSIVETYNVSGADLQDMIMFRNNFKDTLVGLREKMEEKLKTEKENKEMEDQEKLEYETLK